MSTPKHLYTVGYEGQTIEPFLKRLAEIGLRTVVDVRELPLSRKRGFSKRSLAVALACYEIAYVHMPALGCPKSVRNRYKADGDWQRYTRDFASYLGTQDASVNELAKLARATAVCLLCFEADFTRCHRSMVARAAVEAGAPSVVHVTAQTMIPDLARRVAA